MNALKGIRAKACPNCGLQSMLGQSACARIMGCGIVPAAAPIEPQRAECGCLVVVFADSKPPYPHSSGPV